jgi:hypothetical protein
MIDLYEQQVAETRRMNAILERVAVASRTKEAEYATLFRSTRYVLS